MKKVLLIISIVAISVANVALASQVTGDFSSVPGTVTVASTTTAISTPSSTPTSGSGSGSGVVTVGVSGGGGGGGGGGSFYEPTLPVSTTTIGTTGDIGVVLGASTTNPEAILASLMQELIGLEQQLVTQQFKANDCSFDFTENLYEGMSNSQVKNLQIVLNYTSLTQVASTGPGAPGSESTYFGLATKSAVAAFQNIFAAQILTPEGRTVGNGNVGPATRAELNQLCGQ